MGAVKVSFGLIAIHRDPVLDTLDRAGSSHEVVVDMIEAFGPGLQTPLREIDELGTEPAPEVDRVVEANATTGDLCIDSVNIGHLMLFLQMILESLLAATHLGACAASRPLLVTSPCVRLKMLRVFVSLPVILAAETSVTSRGRAAVRPLVTLHMLPGES